MKKLGLTNQLLHAYRRTFENMPEELSQMEGVELKAPLPGVFEKIGRELLGKGIRNLL